MEPWPVMAAPILVSLRMTGAGSAAGGCWSQRDGKPQPMIPPYEDQGKSDNVQPFLKIQSQGVREFDKCLCKGDRLKEVRSREDT
jgi:hypothetical protein